MKVQRVIGLCATLGESPLWHGNALYWTDVNAGRIHRLGRSGEVATATFGEPAIAVVATTDPTRLGVLLGSSVLLWNPVTDRRDIFIRPDIGWPERRFNDAAVDSRGRLWTGIMRNNIAGNGAHLELSDWDGEIVHLGGATLKHVGIGGLGCPNGLAFAPDGNRLYWADSATNLIHMAAYEASTGTHSASSIFDPGYGHGIPDGSAVDSEGFVWNARFGGHCVVRFTPDGSVDRVVDLPVTNPTCCAFGGADGRTLFITSARLLAPAREKLAGAVFALQAGVIGASVPPMALETTQPEEDVT